MAKARLFLSFVIIAAVLISALAIAFAFGWLGNPSVQAGISGDISDLGTMRAACKSYCVNIQSSAGSVGEVQNSDYCKNTFNVDLNKNGRLDKGETGLSCWTHTAMVQSSGDPQAFANPIDVGCVVDFPGDIFQEIQPSDSLKKSPFSCISPRDGGRTVK